jgi:hypothetical protein
MTAGSNASADGSERFGAKVGDRQRAASLGTFGEHFSSFPWAIPSCNHGMFCVLRSSLGAPTLMPHYQCTVAVRCVLGRALLGKLVPAAHPSLPPGVIAGAEKDYLTEVCTPRSSSCRTYPLFSRLPSAP